MHSHIVVGLAFGDEGKGSWVDHLCRLHNINTVVRFNGGAQARHHVTTEAGITHGFAQFGSHSFIPGAKTMLSRYMLIEPLNLLAEAQELSLKGVYNPLQRLYISSKAPIIPFTNVLLNQVMELSRGNSRHGSCGLGIGLTQSDIEDGIKPVIRASDLNSKAIIENKLRIHHRLTLGELSRWEAAKGTEPYRVLVEKFDKTIGNYVSLYMEFAARAQIIPDAAFVSTLRRQPVVFEGAQGAMLDQHQGTFPNCTRSTTTPKNALTLLADAGYAGEVTRHGLFRAYGTRHGAGPFPTEDSSLNVPQCDNGTGEWQGVFRTGWFDSVLARTALSFSEVDQIVLTNLDRLEGVAKLKVATNYRSIPLSFYNHTTETLVPVQNYEESTLRTAALFKAEPTYETLSGFAGSHDATHETYIRFVENQIGHRINALSRKKDHHKVYRT